MSFLYRIFLKGLLTLLPIIITIYLLVWIASSAETALAGPLRAWLPPYFYFPGAGFVVGLVLIFVVGLLVNNYLTQRLVKWFEHRLEVLPIVRSIYSPLRDVTQLFAKSDSAQASQRVVLVKPYGPDGAEILGLVTRDSFSELPGHAVPEGHVAVFIPFSYAMGGMTVIVPKSLARETTIPAEKAMQLSLTAWIKTTNT